MLAVIPAHGRVRRARLFGALERALDVRFEGRAEGDLEGCAGAILLEGGPPPRGIPALVFGGVGAASGAVRISRLDLVDTRLRGVVVDERDASPALDPEPGAVVLAVRDGRPVWAAADGVQWAAATPRELGANEVLLERLEAGQALGLLPLVHFVRGISGGARRPPPLRATFLFDDPNLHWRTYGFVRYERLARHADEHGYHAAMAMVPIDAWFAHPATARLFLQRSERLSLLVHGNNHVKRELAAPREGELVVQLAQALRRVARFERRTGVSVARVMAPPHGAAGEPAMSALLRTGFDGLCITRPYPWLDRPPAEAVLAGWRPAELVAGGFPVLPRLPIRSAARHVALRAFLDQPLILFGHHDDLAGGLEPLAELAAAVNALADVRWMPLGEIVRTNVDTRTDGTAMEVRLHTRRASVDVPEGIDELRVLLPVAHGDVVDEPISIGPDRLLLGAAARDGWRTLSVAARAGPLEIELGRFDALDPWAAARAPWRPTARVRRTLAEGRDRLLPVAAAVRSAASRRGSI